MDDALTLHAILTKVSNATGGGFRLTFDVPTSDLPAVTELMKHIEQPVILAVAIEEPRSGAY